MPAGDETVKGDATGAASLKEACLGASVVYYCVNVPYGEWHHKLLPMMSHIIEAAATADVELVYADNLYSYGKPTGALTEDTPRRAFFPSAHGAANHQGGF